METIDKMVIQEKIEYLLDYKNRLNELFNADELVKINMKHITKQEHYQEMLKMRQNETKNEIKNYKLADPTADALRRADTNFIKKQNQEIREAQQKVKDVIDSNIKSHFANDVHLSVASQTERSIDEIITKYNILQNLMHKDDTVKSIAEKVEKAGFVQAQYEAQHEYDETVYHEILDQEYNKGYEEGKQKGMAMVLGFMNNGQVQF